MRKVKAANVHSSVKHLDKHINVPAGGSKGANNLGLPQVGVDGFEDVLKFDLV